MTTQITLSKRAALFGAALVILAALIFLYWETYNMQPPLLVGYPGDAFFPRLVIGFTAIWNVVLLVRLALAPLPEADPEDHFVSFDWLEFLIVIVLVGAYAALMERLGFEVTTVAFVAALLIPRLRMPWPTALALGLTVAVMTMLVLWAVFALSLKVPLPLSHLPLYLGY